MPWLKLIHVSKSSPWVLAWLTPVVSRSLNIDFIYFNIYLLGHLSLTLFVYSFLSSCKASPLTMRKFQVRTVMQSTPTYFGEGFEQFISANTRLIHEHSYNISCKHARRFAVFFYIFIGVALSVIDAFVSRITLIFNMGDAIWRHKSVSALVQVMAYCLTTPSHYLNQSWLTTSKVQWHSFEGSFTRDTPGNNH